MVQSDIEKLVTSAPVKDHEDLRSRYAPLVEFMGQAMPSNCEFVLHDLTTPDESIIAIVNGHISGRELGGPVTDFALWFMKQGAHNSIPYVAGYRAVNSTGRICRSSSYFIRDEAGELIGMLCINVDVSGLINIQRLAGELIDGTEASDEAPAISPLKGELPTTDEAKKRAVEKHEPSEGSLESLRSNLESLVESMLDTALAQQHNPPENLRREERIQVVADLEEAGFFLLKGGIAAAATRLQVSEPTIYRYLLQIRG